MVLVVKSEQNRHLHPMNQNNVHEDLTIHGRDCCRADSSVAVDYEADGAAVQCRMHHREHGTKLVHEAIRPVMYCMGRQRREDVLNPRIWNMCSMMVEIEGEVLRYVDQKYRTSRPPDCLESTGHDKIVQGHQNSAHSAGGHTGCPAVTI